MIKQVFTVYDEKSNAYLQPFFLDTKGQAIRAITDCVNDIGHAFGRHPSDYTLFHLGEYDDSTGQFITDQKKSLGSLVEFKTQTVMFDDKQLSIVGGTD
jgi:hypothetical protein